VKPSTLAKWIWLLGALALVLGWSRDTVLGLMPKPRELPRLDGLTGQPWISDGFVPNGAHQSLNQGLLPPNMRAASSWVNGDAWTGHAETAWFRANRRYIYVGVAGYPRHAGCKLWAEFRAADGSITRVDCPLFDPHEQWGVWEIRRPADAVAVRVLADDRATDMGGWVAFSHPFRAWPWFLTAIYQHLQLWSTVALALTLVWGPGLLWLSWRSGRPGTVSPSPEGRALVLLGGGPLLLAVLGIAIWCGGSVVPPRFLATAIIATLWLALGLAARRVQFSFALDAATGRALALSALIVVAVTAKSTYSVGPAGELFRGAISRNLTIGDRIDSRYPFHVVQAAAHRFAPSAPETERLFYPWTFFSRGPLGGLAATPVVLATGGNPPVDAPEQRWSPFDAQGFAAYRVTMIVLSSGIIVATAALLLTFLGARWAIVGAGLLALSPFGVHEVMFTWPKWEATTGVVLSFLLVHARRPLAGGFALAVGFLFHPLALLWAPWLALWGAGRAIAASRGAAVITLLRFGVGAALLVLPWMALGAWMPHLPDTPFAGQGGFVRYFLLADSNYATWDTWWRTRWMNFANTFIPLHVYFSGFDHFRFQSAYEPSGRLVKFAFVWWNSLPFGLGLGLWVLSLVALVRAWRVQRAALVLFVIGPALFLTAYWGMDPLGLMRECGHPLFIAILALTCVVAARHHEGLRRVLLHRAVSWLQLPETWLMLWLTTLANRQPWAVDYAHLDPACFAINALALFGAARLLARARGELSDPAPMPIEASVRPAATTPAPAAGAERARLPRVAWLIFALGVMALVICPLRLSIEETHALASVDANDAFAGNRAFLRDAVVASDRFHELPPGLRVRGSWPRSDTFQGTHETGWFRAAPRVSVMVAGFPVTAGNHLELEVRRRDGKRERIPYAIHDVGEAWLRWTVTLPAEAEALRILATDTTAGPGGWLGFSEPFTSRPLVGAQLWSLVQLGTATCLALTLIAGPGLLWFGNRPRSLPSLAFAILPGPLVLAALGVICWMVGGVFAPAALARVGIALLLAWMAWRAWQRRHGRELPREVKIVAAAGALLTGFCVAKANVSFGPPGELFRDRVSRTLEVGGHSDSQISFHVVQAIAHHLGPYAPQTKLYFAPWRFASRGPLAGLMAAPIVLASGAQVPFDHPTHAWRPFDREGFAVYRIACIVLASLAAWPVLALLSALASPAWGLVGAITAQLAPFFVHEMYFSWPKLIAGALVLVAFLALQQRRPFVAGLMIALGYLYHPLAALSGPFLALWLLVQPRSNMWRQRLTALTWFVLGALTLVVPWQIIGRLQPDQGANQDIFVQYFFYADSAHATWRTWWQSRWDNFANTFLPGWLLTANRAHDSLNSAYGPSDRWVQASFLYWNTLPFALGVPAFLLVAVAVARAGRNAFATVFVVLFAPALFLIAYWGAASTGLMRQCGHALILSIIVLAIWSLATWPGGWTRGALAAFLSPACFVWRGLEIAVMALGTTLMNFRHDYAVLFRWNDALSLAGAATCLVAAVVLLVKTAADLRPALSAHHSVSA
jgi:hypothetical protein